MNLPLISEYVDAIKSAEDNFATLTNLRPVMNEDGNPVMTSGNFAVIFKMEDHVTSKFYAVKCFLKEQPERGKCYKMIADELEHVPSTFLVQFRYLDKELFVDTKNSEEDEYPVLIMDWIEGVTLDKYIRQNTDEQYVLQMLAFQFTKITMWIIPQPFAHGDIKPDNVMVREDGSLVLIDYDGMYVPAMNGQKARELGSPDFRHPYRTVDNFNEHIDDFSLVSILLSLYAIANDSSLLDKYGAADRLLLSEKDYHNMSACKLLKEIYPSTDNKINILISLFNIAIINEDISTLALDLLKIVEKLFIQEIDTICSFKLEDLDGYKVDKYGVIYSCDYKILLRVPSDIKVYNVKEGIKIIANDAFNGCRSLQSIFIPDSIESIDSGAFKDCDSLCIYMYSQTYKRLRNYLDYENITIFFKDEKGLPEYGGKWIPKSISHVVKDELDLIVKADVVASRYGLSVRFLWRDGRTSYIPLYECSDLVIGDSINMKEAKVLSLRRNGYDDIFRIVI